MGEKNTVSVKIFGQEYTISGEMPREYIMRVADFVDGKMNEIAEGYNGSQSAVAVLASMNIADDYFKRDDEIFGLLERNEELEKNIAQYIQFWEDAKSSLNNYKNEINIAREQQEEYRKAISERNERIGALTTENDEVKSHNDVLRTRIDELSSQLERQNNAPVEAENRYRELEAKCRDIESSFFDIQMENIHLKNELDNLRKQLSR